MLCASAQVALSQACMPHRSLPKIFLKNMGDCDFNLDSLEYRGTPVEQAKCLMRSVDQTRNLGPPAGKPAGRFGKPHRPRHWPAVARDLERLSVEAGP